MNYHKHDSDAHLPHNRRYTQEILRTIYIHIYRWLTLGGFLGSLLALGMTDVYGTTLVRMSVEAMTAIASDVVIGTCSSVESHWTDDHKQILTYVTLTNTESLKGEARGDVTFVQLGGRVDDEIMQVTGAPTFEVGEKVLVFLTRMLSAKDLAYSTDLWLLGLGQGKWEITRAPETGAETATVSTRSAQVIGETTQGMETNLPLAELMGRIRAAVALQEGQ